MRDHPKSLNPDSEVGKVGTSQNLVPLAKMLPARGLRAKAKAVFLPFCVRATKIIHNFGIRAKLVAPQAVHRGRRRGTQSKGQLRFPGLVQGRGANLGSRRGGRKAFRRETTARNLGKRC